MDKAKAPSITWPAMQWTPHAAPRDSEPKISLSVRAVCLPIRHFAKSAS